MKITVRYCLSSLLLISSIKFAKAQNATLKVSGSVSTETGKPADYATISLLNQQDSVVVKGSLTDDKGNYVFDIKPGNYIVKVTMIGYQKGLSQPINVNLLNVTVPAIVMQPSSKNLQTVNITGTRPLIERRTDRTVMNVENSVLAAGNSAMEILERAPGVSVDKDDNISLNGKQGVTVMINDKLTYLSSAQLATLLRSTDGNTIQSVEIITNPSAKYDAAGNSGILNIKLKKNKQSGTNGSFTTTLARGKYFRDNTSLSLNHKEGAFNFFGTLSRGDIKRKNYIDIQRNVTGNGTTTYFDQYSDRYNVNHNNNYRVGADWDISTKNTLGFVAGGYFNPILDTNINRTDLGIKPGISNSYQNTYSGIHQTYKNFAINLNDRWQIDSAGQALSIDVDYSKFRNNSNAQYDTYFFNSNGSSAGIPQMLRNQTPSVINIKTAKADYIYPLGKNLKFETGAKLSDVKTDNNLIAQLNSTAGYVNDAQLTNHFIYDEKIDAGYVNLSKSYKNTSVQAGLRAEYTKSTGELLTTNQVVNRSYLNFFPSVFINHTINDKNQLGFNYSRRIDRPGYDNLNPFVYFLDQYTYSQGNPFLKPQYTDSYELNYTYKHTINISLGYSRTTDVITQVLLTDTVKKATVQTDLNLKVQNHYNININSPYTINKWWAGNVNLTTYYTGFKSIGQQSGALNSGSINDGKVSYQVKTTQTFAFAQNFKAEVMGDYQSSLIYSYFHIKPQYAIDLGLSHSFAEKKINVKLAVSDIFNTRINNVVSVAQGNIINIRNKNETRIGRLTFTYNFGNSKFKTREHQTGADTEKNRVKGNS